MSGADFVKRFDDVKGPADLGDAAGMLHAMGATWLRVTPLLEISEHTYILEGWRVRPEDQGPAPTADTAERG